jgi:hypothetical protein
VPLLFGSPKPQTSWLPKSGAEVVRVQSLSGRYMLHAHEGAIGSYGRWSFRELIDVCEKPEPQAMGVEVVGQ